jgi:hypothetical protein
VGVVVNDRKVPPGVDVDRFARSLAMLSNRHYFKRVWVAQGVFLAQEAKICCGGFIVPVRCFQEELAAAAGLLWQFTMPRHETVDLDHLDPAMIKHLIDLVTAMRDVRQSFNVKCESGIPDLETKPGRPGRLKRHVSSAMLQFSKLQCQAPKDHVYGALGMIYSERKAPI